MEGELFIVICCLVMGLLAMVIAFFTLVQKRNIQALEKAQQLETFRIVIDAESKQKAKISSNLHDQIVPQLSILKLRIDNLPKTDNDQKTALKSDVEIISSEIRTIAHNLAPKILSSEGLIAAIELYVEKLNGALDSVVTFYNETEDGENVNFSIEDQSSIYSICLEILNNLQKHSNYSRLNVRLQNTRETFSLIFSHNGVPISNAEIEKLRQSKEGLGLKSIQSRLLILKGELDYSFDEIANIKLIVPKK